MRMARTVLAYFVLYFKYMIIHSRTLITALPLKIKVLCMLFCLNFFCAKTLPLHSVYLNKNYKIIKSKQVYVFACCRYCTSSTVDDGRKYLEKYSLYLYESILPKYTNIILPRSTHHSA